MAERVSGRRRPGVLFLSWGNFTAGRGTLLDEIMDRAGAENLASEAGLSGTAPISLELAVALQPDAILSVAGEHEDPAELFRGDPRWAALPAVRSGRVLGLPTALALSTSHHAVRTVEVISDWLHPAEVTP